jgi:CubicO group peptidase (beta-lactamase class C family)
MRQWVGTTVGLAALIGAGGVAWAGQAQRQPAPASQTSQRQPAPVSQASQRPTMLRETQGLFDAYVQGDKMPGIVGAFGVGGSPTEFVAAGRIADGAATPIAGPDTLWRIYSMTKPITGMAAMMLVEDGKLRLDQPLSDFFPQYRSMRVAVSPDTSLETRPARTPITIRHLLTHSGGLGYSISAKGPLLKEYERLGLLPFAASAQSEAAVQPTRPRSLVEFAERAAQVPLIAEPGTKWSYSMGLDIMGAVIERASGMSFERFVQTRMFDPLGMRSTYWQVPAGEAARLATNYAWVGDARAPLDPGATSTFLSRPSFAYGGAGLVSSARDYDRFLHMLANGGTLDGRRVMKAETVRLAMSNLLPSGVTFGGLGGGTGGTTAAVPMGFGAGGSVYLADMPGGASKGTYGWGGAAGTIAWVDPVKLVRGTVMVNYFPAERWPIRREVTAALFRDAARLHGPR